MPALKLTKLPDRKPVRLTIKIGPDLNKALERYATLYRETYGEAESAATLIPFMLESFLNDDRAFAKAMKVKGGGDGTAGPDTSPSETPRRRGTPSNSSSSAGSEH